MTARSRERHDVDSHTRTHRRPTTAPFVGQWALWFVALPAIGTFLWWIGQDLSWCIQLPDDTACRVRVPLAPNRPDVRVLAAGGAVFVTCAVSTVSAVVGVFVTKRHAVVVTHVAAAWVWAGLAVLGTTAFGWSWVWFVAHTVISAIGAFGWNVYKADALRSDRGEKEKVEVADSFGKLVGLPNAVVGEPRIDAHHIRATIDPGVGKTMGDIAGRLEAIEDRVRPALPGRARIERNPVTKFFDLVFMHKDPLEPWPLWSGPSDPGGTFADGGVAGVYGDAVLERIRFAAAVDEHGNQLPAQQCCSVGMTRSGKTGHACVLWTDIGWTRRDVLMGYADGAKPGQSLAGRLQDDIALFADTVQKARLLFEMLNDLGKWRAERMGAAGFRDWSPEVHAQLGFAAILVAIDEGDLICALPAFRNLATKGLSTGLFCHSIIPRMDGESMDTTARTAFGQSLTFGTGDDYSHTFSMSKRTALAGGAKVCDWKQSKPGYHVWDAAPGVDENRYPMDVRSLRAEFDELIPHIVAGREYRATWSPEEYAFLKAHKHWAALQPKRTPSATWSPIPAVVPQPATPTPTPIPATAATPTPAPSGQTKERIEMHPDPNANPYDDAPSDGVPDVPAMDDPEPGDRERYANADPHAPGPEPIAEGSPEDYEWSTGDERPVAPNQQAARDAVDLVLRQFIAAGKDTFTLGEFHQAYPFRRSLSWSSRRLADIAAGDWVYPPGATIERLGNVGEGAFAIVRDPTVIPGNLVADHAA